MIHDLLRDETVVDHLVVFHAAESAVLHTAAEFLLLQTTLQELAHAIDGAAEVLNNKRNPSYLTTLF